ncbi:MULTISPECIES: DUF5996 family protein [unclassified Pseudoclavibacter]|uniref:DUF5996 family protein n=1 Tax=unclassified Pseudoclavibacter TaxID=2615177 RepID=UPI001C722EC7|nr:MULTISPECIES: DUF5996 family protein [unclassified Pseudoclavibacter]
MIRSRHSCCFRVLRCPCRIPSSLSKLCAPRQRAFACEGEIAQPSAGDAAHPRDGGQSHASGRGEGAYYSYAYPSPAGFAEVQVPDGAYWDGALGEFLLPYEAVRASTDPDALLHSFLTATYNAAATLADWESVNQNA